MSDIFAHMYTETTIEIIKNTLQIFVMLRFTIQKQKKKYFNESKHNKLKRAIRIESNLRDEFRFLFIYYFRRRF